jgi:mannose-6-phosphate isomerase
VVQHYAWGGYDYIPDLLGVKNEAQQPFAELWLGAHAKAPSILVMDEDEKPLNEFLGTFAHAVLGQKIIHRFGEKLPFLFKVLDARDMLSIQVHPSKAQAEEGFARENKEKIALDASNRSYKDDNHKPEVHVALTDFWMLHGFRPAKEIEQILKQVGEFRSLLTVFLADGTEALYRHIMLLPQTQVDKILSALIHRLEDEEPDDMDAPDYWALKAAQTFPLPDGHFDRGIFSVYLLNLLHLNPGESTYQAAGVPHAYLYGTTMELMANSDNVLRGGLTPKYVDVDELLKTINFKGAHPEVMTGEVVSYAERIYKTPADDFELSKLTLYAGETFQNMDAKTPEILLLLNGKISVMCGWDEDVFERGESCFSPASTTYNITALEDATLFRAKVPF